MAQVAVKVYRDMLRSEEPTAAADEPPPTTTTTTPPTEVGRLRQRADKVWLALGLVGRDLVTDTDAAADEVATAEELRNLMLEEVRGGLLERLDRIIQTLQRWLNLFALFLSRFFFFEFPNNLRHLCTTMPWSIWPALVVLWGVCWMFYNGNNGAATTPVDGMPNDVNTVEELDVPQQPYDFSGHAQASLSPLSIVAPTTPTGAIGGSVMHWNGTPTMGYPTSNPPSAVPWMQDTMMVSPDTFSPANQTFGAWDPASSGLGPTPNFGASGSMDQGPLPLTAPAGLVGLGVGGGPNPLGPFFAPVSPNAPAENAKWMQAGSGQSIIMDTPPISPPALTGHNPVSAGHRGGFPCDEPGCSKTYKTANGIK